ncbi:hypothetical protein D3C80_1272790 [compost metagenome]
MPPSSTSTRSISLTQGKAKLGSPCGNLPSTFTPCWSSPSRLTASVASTTAMRMPGRRLNGLSSRISAKLAPPTMKLGQCPWPASKAWIRFQISRSGPWLSTDRPNSFGSWLINTVRAMPFM